MRTVIMCLALLVSPGPALPSHTVSLHIFICGFMPTYTMCDFCTSLGPEQRPGLHYRVCPGMFALCIPRSCLVFQTQENNKHHEECKEICDMTQFLETEVKNSDFEYWVLAAGDPGGHCWISQYPPDSGQGRAAGTPADGHLHVTLDRRVFSTTSLCT